MVIGYSFEASNFVIRVSKAQRNKKRSSAVAGKSVLCFETQVGAGVKTVGMNLEYLFESRWRQKFIEPIEPGMTSMATRPIATKHQKLLLLGGLLRRLLSCLLSDFLCHI